MVLTMEVVVEKRKREMVKEKGRWRGIYVGGIENCRLWWESREEQQKGSGQRSGHGEQVH